MGNVFQREPARIAGVITNFLTVVLMLLAAFGLNIGEDQQNAILAAIVPTIALVQMMFELTRNQVVPTAKAGPLIQTALQQHPETIPAGAADALQDYDLQKARRIISLQE